MGPETVGSASRTSRRNHPQWVGTRGQLIGLVAALFFLAKASRWGPEHDQKQLAEALLPVQLSAEPAPVDSETLVRRWIGQAEDDSAKAMDEWREAYGAWKQAQSTAADSIYAFLQAGRNLPEAKFMVAHRIRMLGAANVSAQAASEQKL